MTLKMLWATMQFITRIPVPEAWSRGVEFKDYSRGVVWFPVVGAVIGAGAGLCWLAVSKTGGGAPLAAAVYVFALALLTGGFHLDGLADTCDGVFSARTRERMLEIMRDSRLGTYGGLALVFCITFKILAVVSLAAPAAPALFALLVCGPIVGRAGIVMAMYRERYARDGTGMGNVYIGHVAGRDVLVTLLITVGLVIGLTGARGLLAAGVSLCAMYAIKRFLSRRLKGLTGDTLGATEEMGELVFLLALVWF